jgi:hypothetical protein
MKGIGEDSVEIYNPIKKQKEIVHTYGWYMRKIHKGNHGEGAIAIVCSPVPRNNWKDGRVTGLLIVMAVGPNRWLIKTALPL